MTAIESDTQSSVITEEGQFHWGKEVPEELQEEATLVSNLALDLFQKLKIHPNVYVPCNKKNTEDWCRFFWRNDSGQYGFILLNRHIKTEKGKRKEITHTKIQNFYRKDVSKFPYIDNATFKIEGSKSGCTTMPTELRIEVENLIKVSSVFFRKLVEHPDVIVMDGGTYFSDWESFRSYDKQEQLNSTIAFSDEVNDSGSRIQQLYLTSPVCS